MLVPQVLSLDYYIRRRGEKRENKIERGQHYRETKTILVMHWARQDAVDAVWMVILFFHPTVAFILLKAKWHSHICPVTGILAKRQQQKHATHPASHCFSPVVMRMMRVAMMVTMMMSLERM